ncbi:MAG: DUF3072 domain-containing protein [Mycobacterium sp.]|nr:DUF3072 domain-containing protein [Mycobacterium sp.]
MTDDADGAPRENPEKDRSQWVTGDEPMTGPRRSYLSAVAREAGREVADEFTTAQGSALIDELRQRPGRGRS